MSGTPDQSDGGLARRITPRLLLVLVVGNVLGAGIYVVVGEVARDVGGGVWLAFVVAFVVAAVSALTLCELVTKYPGAAGVALYVERAFARPMLTFVVGFAILASGLTSAATAARAFGGDYLAEFWTVEPILAAAVFIGLLAAVNYWGVIESLRANVVMTTIELAGLVIVITAAVLVLGQGRGDLGRAVEFGDGDALVPIALLGAAAVAFFSFLGFEDVANMSEEVRRPRVAYPLALFGGLAIVAAIYLAVTVLAVAAVEPDRLSGSSGPLLLIVDDSPVGVGARVFALIALVAVANTALANLVMGSRLLYGMSGQGLMPAVLGLVDPRRSTPWVAVLATGVVAFALAATGDLAGLARTTVLLLLSVLFLMNLSGLRLRRESVLHRHFIAPSWAPWLGASMCLVLLVNQLVTGEWVDAARALAIVLLGLALHGMRRVSMPGRARRRGGRAAGDAPPA